MSRIKLTYKPSGVKDAPVRCFLFNGKVQINTIGVDEADAYKKMCKLVKRLYRAMPKMREFLYERGKP